MAGTDVADAEGDPTTVTACAPVKGVARLMATFGVVSGLWLLAASRWIVTDTVVPWDSKNQFYAFFRFLASSIHAGVSPFWNPYHYGGHPSVADPQSLIFAPLFVLWALIDPDAVAARVRSHRVCASPGRWPRDCNDRLAGSLAVVGLRAGGRAVHVRRRCRGPAAAHRPDHYLWAVSAGDFVAAARARASLACERAGLCLRGVGARARAQPGLDAHVLRARRHGGR